MYQLYLYDHGGLRIGVRPFGDPWDSGPVGWSVATPDAIRTTFGCQRITKRIRAQVQACLKAEVEVYDAYLRGDDWGYIISGDAEGAPGDSCFGFYGDTLHAVKDHAARGSSSEPGNRASDRGRRHDVTLTASSEAPMPRTAEPPLGSRRAARRERRRRPFFLNLRRALGRRPSASW